MNDISAEISLARFVIDDEKFAPGDDLKALVSRFAKIEFASIPFQADGISVKPKSAERPLIVVNSDNPPTRQTFTLAHELGHVLIPWHVGTICSHIDNDLNREDEYYRQEGEANRFASELLVPTEWVVGLFQNTQDPATTLKHILDTVKVSPPAAIIKLMHCLPPGFVCTEKYSGASSQYHSSAGTAFSPAYESNPDRIDYYDKTADGRFALKLGNYSYDWWYFSHEHELPSEKLQRPWRDALTDILNAVPLAQRKFAQQSLNGIIASASQRRGNVEEAYCYIVSRVKGAEYAPPVIDHPDFRPFVMARLEELAKSKSSKA